MSPQVIARKLAALQEYLSDLKGYASQGRVHQDHYAVERLIQLIVECMYDIMTHWLAAHGFTCPDRYADILSEAGHRAFLSPELAARLVNAARMRNLLVHAYERIDLDKLEQAVPAILTDVQEFIREVSRRQTGGPAGPQSGPPEGRKVEP